MNKKILIIEDNERDLQILLDCLEDQDYEIISDRDGENALHHIEDEKPDLIILDLVLPEVDGFKICKHINSLRGSWNPKLIIITGITQVLSSHKSDWFQETKADALMTKPVTKIELLEKIKSLLNR